MSTQQWTDELLDKMRLTSDDPADKAAAALFKNKDHAEIFAELKEMALNDAAIPASFPVDLSNYFKDIDLNFTEKEKQKLDLAAAVFREHGIFIMLMLYFKSLPTGYMCPKPAHVLGTTHLLIDYTTRRILETAKYLLDVSSQNWYLPKGKGITSIKKVRLMHAGMRLMIQTNPNVEWDTEFYGIPINQEDLVLTQQLFSLTAIRGLRRMGVVLTPEERDAYFFKWNVIGRLMGVDQILRPDSISSGWRLQNKILSRQVNMPDPDGPVLAEALIDMVLDHMPSMVTKKSFEKMTMYFINNNKCYQTLGFHKPSLWERLFDKLVYVLVSMEWWEKLFSAKDNLNELGFIKKIVRYLIARRFGLKQSGNKSKDKSVIELLSKHMVKSLKEKAVLSDGKKFEVDGEFSKKWGIDSFEFDEAEGITSDDSK